MTLLPAIYRPTGALWPRLRHALFTAYVNLHIRFWEGRSDHFYRQLERLGIL